MSGGVCGGVSECEWWSVSGGVCGGVSECEWWSERWSEWWWE